jgi:phosphatidylglycerol---prolipoprotein diacylglyceryl transferase
MRQVLFYLPLHSLSDSLPDIPVYGYGMMLFMAFVLCSWLAGRLARREGVDPKVLPDLAIWLFVTGILGARLTFVLQEWPSFFGEGKNPLRVFALWDGGLVLYGSIIGGAIGYFLAYRRLLAPANISSWKMADILAPGIALGVCLGRVGCLLTGCCFGNVVCTSCPAIVFPLPSYPTQDMARLGYQTLGGFTVDPSDLRVVAVEPDSAAAQAGLKPGDSIVNVNGLDTGSDKHEKTKEGADVIVSRYELFATGLINAWPPGVHQLHLKVLRDGHEVQLQAFLPVSLPLHPTQIYETISMGLLLFLLLSYYPFKKLDGSVMVLLMVGYGLHRFLNEMLRIDNPPLAFGLTFSQLVSIGVLIGACVLAYFVVMRRASAPAEPVPAVNTW